MSQTMGTSRRAVLLGAGAALLGPLVGCRPAAGPVPPPTPDPDDVLRAAAAACEQALLVAYDAALLVAPALASRLAPLRAEHVEHLAALTGPLAPAPGSPAPSAPPVAPPQPAAALTTLADAERTAAARHADDAAAAGDRVLASLLAALSASEQSHPVALA